MGFSRIEFADILVLYYYPKFKIIKIQMKATLLLIPILIGVATALNFKLTDSK
jgi:hypothetical protein